MAADFQLTFEMDPLRKLDEFALLACQDYNLGGVGEWFEEFSQWTLCVLLAPVRSIRPPFSDARLFATSEAANRTRIPPCFNLPEHRQSLIDP